MNDVALSKAPDPGPAGLAGRAAEGALAYLARNNVLYILSALMLLVGCFLVTMPCLFDHARRIGGILILLGVVNLYEAMVISAAGWLARRSPASRECSTLILVETLLVFDATLTVNAFLPLSYRWGLVIAGASAALALVKIFVLEAAAGRPVFRVVAAVLVPAVLFTYSFQGVLAIYAAGQAPARLAATYCVWLALGLIPLGLLGARIAPWGSRWRPAGGGEAPPWWQGPGFARTVALAALGMPLLHLAGASWVHSSPSSSAFAVPAVMSLLVVLPVLVRFEDSFLLGTLRTAAAATVLLWTALVPEAVFWRLDVLGSGLVLSPLRVNLLFAAGCFLVMWLRERTACQLETACALGVLAAVVHSDGAVLAFARWTPVAALVAVTVLKSRSGALRAGLAAVVFAVGLQSAGAVATHSDACFAAAGVALAAAALTGGRRYLYLLLAYLAAADIVLGTIPSPSGAAQWGAVVIAGAFAVFGAAFLVTRRALAAGRSGRAGTVLETADGAGGAR